MHRVDIRRANLADAEAIREIYNIEVAGSTATLDLVPRTPEEQASWMVAHSGVYPVIVADDGGQVIGFASLSPYRPRPSTRRPSRTRSTSQQSIEARGSAAPCSEAVVMARTHGFHSVVARVRQRYPASVGGTPSSLRLRPHRRRAGDRPQVRPLGGRGSPAAPPMISQPAAEAAQRPGS